MFVTVNGERRELPPEATVLNAVELLAGDGEHAHAVQGRGVAVAVEGEVVPRRAWERTELRQGARIEVVTAVQGG